MTEASESLLSAVRAKFRSWWQLWRSIDACSVCLRPERPWRPMLVYPIDGVFANVCGDDCWDDFAARSRKDECPRCGSDEWQYLDYGGCSECRPYEERKDG